MRLALHEAGRLCEVLLGRGEEPASELSVRELGEREMAAALALVQRADPPLVALQCQRGLKARLRRTLFERALRNLVLNALHATPASRTVRVVVRPDGVHDLVVDVLDEGRGMAPAELRRCVQSGQSGRGSTGLGLSSVLDCVERMGAVLELRSLRGEGTTARLTLPGVLGPPASALLVVDPEPQTVEPRGIRVVERVASAITLVLNGTIESVVARRTVPTHERARLARVCVERGVPYSEAAVW
jgi:hypothetical protein